MATTFNEYCEAHQTAEDFKTEAKMRVTQYLLNSNLAEIPGIPANLSISQPGSYTGYYVDFAMKIAANENGMVRVFLDSWANDGEAPAYTIYLPIAVVEGSLV